VKSRLKTSQCVETVNIHKHLKVWPEPRSILQISVVSEHLN